MNLATAAGGIFSELQVDNFMQMTQEQKNEFTTHFMINMVADKGKKKAQDEAIQKQQEQTMLNLTKNKIRLEKEKRKSVVHGEFSQTQVLQRDPPPKNIFTSLSCNTYQS